MLFPAAGSEYNSLRTKSTDIWQRVLFAILTNLIWITWFFFLKDVVRRSNTPLKRSKGVQFFDLNLRRGIQIRHTQYLNMYLSFQKKGRDYGSWRVFPYVLPVPRIVQEKKMTDIAGGRIQTKQKGASSVNGKEYRLQTGWKRHCCLISFFVRQKSRMTFIRR